MLPPSQPPPTPNTEPVERKVDVFFHTVKLLLRAPVRPDWTGLVWLLLIVFVSGSGVASAAALLVALAMRDLVRLTTMKLLNAFDARLLIFPLGRGELPIGTTPAREAVVILSGPAFLVALSAAAWGASKVVGPGIVQDLSRVSVGLAAFTLLPLKPYDGWRLLNLAIFSRWATLEMVVGLLTSIALGLLGIALKAWFIAFFSIFNAIAALRVLKISRAVGLLGSTPMAPIETGALDEHPLRVLYEATVTAFAPAFSVQQPSSARLCASTMKEVHLRAARPVPSVGIALALVTVYAALIAYFVIGLFLLVNANASTAT